MQREAENQKAAECKQRKLENPAEPSTFWRTWWEENKALSPEMRPHPMRHGMRKPRWLSKLLAKEASAVSLEQLLVGAGPLAKHPHCRKLAACVRSKLQLEAFYRL